MKNRFGRSLLLLLCLTSSRISAAETLIQESPIKIATSDEQGIFPQSWRSGRISARGQSIQNSEISRSQRILDAAMKKYPGHMLTSNIEAVYVLQRLEYSGISAAGANSRNRIFIANRGSRDGFTDCFVEGIFHAEFSSILLRNFPQSLDTQSWNTANNASFKYGSSGVQAVRDGRARQMFDATSHSEGFLYEYAKSTLENDFNSIAKHMFLGNSQFWFAVNNYEKIRKKANLTVDFYHRTDSSFNRSFFESLRNSCNNR